MLSFILRLAFDYEREHGSRPNLLYLNPDHLQRLRGELAGDGDIREMARRLRMEIMISRDAVHPQVVRLPLSPELRVAS